MDSATPRRLVNLGTLMVDLASPYGQSIAREWCWSKISSAPAPYGVSFATLTGGFWSFWATTIDLNLNRTIDFGPTAGREIISIPDLADVTDPGAALEAICLRLGATRVEPGDGNPDIPAMLDLLTRITTGPWSAHETELVWSLHGYNGLHQILKAPKKGTPYAEYWPTEADARLITQAPTWLAQLLSKFLEKECSPSSKSPGESVSLRASSLECLEQELAQKKQAVNIVGRSIAIEEARILWESRAPAREALREEMATLPDDIRQALLLAVSYIHVFDGRRRQMGAGGRVPSVAYRNYFATPIPGAERWFNRSPWYDRGVGWQLTEEGMSMRDLLLETWEAWLARSELPTLFMEE